MHQKVPQTSYCCYGSSSIENSCSTLTNGTQNATIIQKCHTISWKQMHAKGMQQISGINGQPKENVCIFTWKRYPWMKGDLFGPCRQHKQTQSHLSSSSSSCAAFKKQTWAWAKWSRWHVLYVNRTGEERRELSDALQYVKRGAHVKPLLTGNELCCQTQKFHFHWQRCSHNK